MSIVGIESNAIGRAVADWHTIGERMATLSDDMAGYDLGGLPSSVLGDAQAFMDTWSGVAGDSADIADGFAAALQATLDDHRGVDDVVSGEFDDLEGSVRS